MFSAQTHALICGSFFAALVIALMGGNALQASGIVHDPGAVRTPFVVLIFVLLLGFGFSAVPVMVNIVLGFQRWYGNEQVPAVAAVLRTEKWIVYAIWALMAAGIAVAIPAAIKGGLFNPAVSGTPSSQDSTGAEPGG
ncbi:MAG TPA: hypothetical protein VGL35_09050 [Rhizomicrobium sp.]|jgi:hypothetical protein